jgi:hypothetical protein
VVIHFDNNVSYGNFSDRARVLNNSQRGTWGLPKKAKPESRHIILMLPL